MGFGIGGFAWGGCGCGFARFGVGLAGGLVLTGVSVLRRLV